ncbi:hypothetical protein ACWGCK_32560, partial [Streptomyces virginiae]
MPDRSVSKRAFLSPHRPRSPFSLLIGAAPAVRPAGPVPSRARTPIPPDLPISRSPDLSISPEARMSGHRRLDWLGLTPEQERELPTAVAA